MKTFNFAGKTICVNDSLRDAIETYLAYATLNPKQVAVIDPTGNLLTDAGQSLWEAVFESCTTETHNLTDDQRDELYDRLTDEWYEQDVINDLVELVG